MTETASNLDAPFLCVGRFIPEKNHALLLKAFSHYQSNGGMRSLLLVGHGPLEHQIRHACQQLPRPQAVKMAPFVELEKLASHYGRSHALVLASRKDTWALVVNEAMAAGLPVIVSRACGCVDDLVEDGVNGWSFACDDVQGLVECLEQSDRQLAEERKTMTSLAKLRLKNFSPESFALGLKKACEHALLNQQNVIAQ